MGPKPIGNRLLIALAMIALTGLGLSVASAQTGSQPQNTRSAVASLGLRPHLCCLRPRRRPAEQEQRRWTFAQRR